MGGNKGTYAGAWEMYWDICGGLGANKAKDIEQIGKQQRFGGSRGHGAYMPTQRPIYPHRGPCIHTGAHRHTCRGPHTHTGAHAFTHAGAYTHTRAHTPTQGPIYSHVIYPHQGPIYTHRGLIYPRRGLKTYLGAHADTHTGAYIHTQGFFSHIYIYARRGPYTDTGA